MMDVDGSSLPGLTSQVGWLLTCYASSHTPPGVQISKPYYISIDLLSDLN